MYLLLLLFPFADLPLFPEVSHAIRVLSIHIVILVDPFGLFCELFFGTLAVDRLSPGLRFN